MKIASAVGGLMILGTSAAASAQSAPERSGEPVTRIASFPPGSIQGTILDEKGEPVAGAGDGVFRDRDGFVWGGFV